MSNDVDLGFTYAASRNQLVISYRNRPVTTLRGNKAQAVQAKLDGATFAQQQQHMARLTGNFKRG